MRLQASALAGLLALGFPAPVRQLRRTDGLQGIAKRHLQGSKSVQFFGRSFHAPNATEEGQWLTP